jgi:basic membrane protein A
MRMHSAGMAVGLAVTMTFLAACGESGSTKPTDVAAGNKNADTLVCMPVDGPTVFDKSFTQTAWAGLQKAEKELGVKIKYVTGQQTIDLEPNMRAMINQKCDLIVGVGYTWGDVTQKLAKEFPDQKFAIIDYSYEDPASLPNVTELTFQTDQSSFLAGIAAAGVSKTGKVGVFGGLKVQPVTIFMDGFQAGINYFNDQKSKDVKLLGWDAKSQTGLFTGDFLNVDNGRRTSETLFQQGADVIMPVAGQVGLGTLAASKEKADTAVVWVDTDGCISAAESCPQILTSSMKNMDVSIFETIKQLTEDDFKSGLYVGELKNNGVALADFHDWKSKVPADVAALVETARQGIIDGSIDVTEWAKK